MREEELRRGDPIGPLDQSQFCNHFKRLVGVTPGRFRMPARIA